MKQRLHLIILLASLALSGMAQTIGEAFYIYRNDGQFNAFFRDEVDSIAYSYYDADSVRYDEVVTQMVYTADSIYRIPLAAIDSVGFVQQAPVYEDNTTELSGELVDYIISVDGMIINMRGDTPDRLLPKEGDKLAQLGFTDIFPDGFVGQVASVISHDGMISIACDSLTIDDVVKSYSAVYRLEIADDNSLGAKSVNAAPPIDLFNKTLPTVTIPIHVNLEYLGGVWKNETLHEETGLAGCGDLTIDLTPTISIKVAYYRNSLLNVFPRYNIHVVTDLSVSEEVRLMGIIKGERKWPAKLPGVLEKLKDYPIAPGVTLYLDAGMKVSGEGRLGAGANFSQRGSHVMDINFYPLIAPLVPPVSTVTQHLNVTSHDEEWLYFLGDFEVKIGPFLEIGFGLINHKISKVGVELDCGAKFSGSVKFDPVAWSTAEKTTDFYDYCKDDSKMAFDVYLGGNLIAAALDERLKFSLGGDIDLPLFHKEATLLPSFKDVILEQKAGSLKFSTNTGSNCIFPLQVGAALFNSEDSRLQTESYGEKYWTPRSFRNYDVTFEDVPSSGEFTAYPTVRLFGKDILASPKAELDVEFPVTLSEFEVTKSQYKKNGFSHNGQQYDYCFNVSVTATLDDEANDISEWGYAYLDPDGNEALIPLSSYGSTYTDTRYAYYRNQAKSTCTLYGYVKYEGSDEPVYGEPQEYPLEYEGFCPDDHHPHMIDLGLPSGTKWACCNIGAVSPDARGGEYAWGETEEKSSYSANNYKFAVPSENGYIRIDGILYNFIFIGENICSTTYDVAHAKWGGAWRMPTNVELQELCDNCSWNLETVSGVYGYRVTGNNGSSIFLPGYYLRYWSGVLDHAGSYWGGGFEPIPYILWSDPNPHVHSPVSQDNWLGYFTGPYQGCNVRAVCDSTLLEQNATDSSSYAREMPAQSGSKHAGYVIEITEDTQSQERKAYMRIVRKEE